MKTNYYQKPQISVEDQIKLLKSEGLTFINKAKANHLLQNISLFRLKSYLKPFRLQNSKIFKTNSTFEAAYALYKFVATDLIKYYTFFASGNLLNN